MPNYVRAFVPGGTFFFTVTLLERQRCLLTQYISDLREVFADVMQRYPFTIDGMKSLKGGIRVASPALHSTVRGLTSKDHLNIYSNYVSLIACTTPAKSYPCTK